MTAVNGLSTPELVSLARKWRRATPQEGDGGFTIDLTADVATPEMMERVVHAVAKAFKERKQPPPLTVWAHSDEKGSLRYFVAWTARNARTASVRDMVMRVRAILGGLDAE